MRARQRVVVDDAVDGVVAILHRDVVAERAEVVAHVRQARWLHAGEHPLPHRCARRRAHRDGRRKVGGGHSAGESSRQSLRYDRPMDQAPPESTTPSPSALDGKRVALLGLGTVGTAVATQLLDEEWRSSTRERGHAVPTLVGVAVRDAERERRVMLPESVRVTTDVESLVGADDVDIVVEVMGGTDMAAVAIRQAFAAGKPVVSANKELLAKQGPDLEAAAREAG